MSNEQVFVFPDKQKVANITVDELSKSVVVRSARSNDPGPTRPLQHWELIGSIHAMAVKHNAEFSQKEIWVEKSNAVRMSTNEEDKAFDWNEKNTPLNKWLFDHMITKIDLTPVGAVKGFNPAVAISYNKRGIQVVWGMNVQVCTNLCIFGDNSISTFGSQRTPFHKQMELLEFWITKMEEKFAQDVETVKEMKKKKINQAWINESVGDLYTKAIDKAYNKGPIAPLNTGTLSTLVQKMNVEDVKTIWDFYNVGTNIIVPGNVAVDEVLNTNMAWGKYLLEKV